jgi:CheY-like chemotaxis protein
MADQGIGAAFPVHDYLVKPVHDTDLLASLERAGVSPEGDGPILVVDDEPADQKLAEAVLAQRGYKSIQASDGAEALQAATRRRPSAVVLDLLMTGMDGFQFLTRFRRTAAGRRTPVIVWTSAELTAEQRAQLQEAAQLIVLKSAGGASALLEELQRLLPASRSPGGPAASGGGSRRRKSPGNRGAGNG